MKLPQWANSVVLAGRRLLQRDPYTAKKKVNSEEDLLNLCRELLSTKGEAVGITLAAAVEEAYQQLIEDEKIAFFKHLFEHFSIDTEKVSKAIDEFQSSQESGAVYRLHKATEASRLELFRRINMAPKGTKTLVEMREDLLPLLKENEQLKDIDLDLTHLMRSWFNRGFLKLVEINWQTPAHILEKLMEYEAVHSMNGWEDLRRRLAADRRCYAFFHPAMQDEPIIFVQVALSCGLSSSIQELLETPEREELDNSTDTAIFYSISDCQKGLKGISLGNFLIKQVVMEIRKEAPQINQFATLSPIPGFRNWLRKKLEEEEPNNGLTELIKFPLVKGPISQAIYSDEQKTKVLKLCAEYLYLVKKNEEPIDPVARFHLRNGASIRRLNWNGDTSFKGVEQSLGIMVNYHYDLTRVEERHEAFVNQKKVSIDKEFSKQISDTEIQSST